jgi:hypothetical protein
MRFIRLTNDGEPEYLNIDSIDIVLIEKFKGNKLKTVITGVGVSVFCDETPEEVVLRIQELK